MGFTLTQTESTWLQRGRSTVIFRESADDIFVEGEDRLNETSSHRYNLMEQFNSE